MNNKKSKQPKKQSKMNQLQNLSYLELLSDDETECVQGGANGNFEYTLLPYPDPFPKHDRFIGGGRCIGEIPAELKGKLLPPEKLKEISKYVLCPPSHAVGLGLFT